MSENGEEKELILGNKQLVSLFFVVVALCGVFFAMGYMVRGNALKGTLQTTDEAAMKSETVKRQQPEPPRETAAAEPPPAETETAPAPATHPAEDTRPAETAPALGAAPAPYVDPKATDAAKVPALASGTYVQVGALHLPDAQSTVRTLKEQHLPATYSPSTTKEGLFRVLVGPYHQTADVADAKVRLKALGFADMVVTKQP